MDGHDKTQAAAALDALDDRLRRLEEQAAGLREVVSQALDAARAMRASLRTALREVREAMPAKEAPEPDATPEPEGDLYTWEEAERGLVTREAVYAEAGSAGAFVREYVLRPLRDRFNRGERSDALLREIMEVSL